MNELSESKIKEIIESCRYKDFPIQGVDYFDIFQIIHQIGMRSCASWLFSEVKKALGSDFNNALVFMPESRSYIFYYLWGSSRTIQLRKKGKTPGETLSYQSTKEYGSDELFISKDHLAKMLMNFRKDEPVKVIFFDDVLATGQTAKSFKDFIESLEFEGFKFEVVSFVFYFEIKKLNGRSLLNSKVFSNHEY